MTSVYRTGQDGVIEITIGGTTHRIAWDDYSDPCNVGWILECADGWMPIDGATEDATDADLIAMVS